MTTTTKTTDNLRSGDKIALAGSTFEVWEVRAHPMADRFPTAREVTGYMNRPAGICEPSVRYVEADDVFEVKA